MSIHIALYDPTLTGSWTGGAQKGLLNLACGFAQRGLKVDLVVISPAGPEQLLAEVELTGVRIVSLQWPRRGFSTVIAMISYLRRERPDFLISGLDGANLVAIWAKYLSIVSTRVFVQETNNISHHLKQRSLKKRLTLALMRFSYRWADSIIAVSQGLAQDMAYILNLPIEHIRVIYNMTMAPGLLTKEPTFRIEEPWFDPDTPPVILGAGRLYQQKDFSTLIRAFALVRQQRQARLIILGEGEERIRLASLVKDLDIQDDVAMPGFVIDPYTYVWYMDSADVFVLSSIYEGLPTVLFDAIACGTQCVSTDCENGPREILGEGKYGRLVPVGDVNSLAEAILAALDNPIDPDLLRQQAEKFSPENIIDTYLVILGIERL